MLFKPEIDATSFKELLPENKPTGPVPAGSIAVSNTISKRIGLVGVKLKEDKRYGPSGEKFEATNLRPGAEPRSSKTSARGDDLHNGGALMLVTKYVITSPESDILPSDIAMKSIRLRAQCQCQGNLLRSGDKR